MHAASETYRIGSDEFEGYLAFDGASASRRPGVLVFHQWSGCSPFEREKADWLAGLGYAALAVDMYGKGKRGSNPQENGALMTAVVSDRALLRRRAEGAVQHLRSLPMVDGDRIGAIGFCFGGLCALDLARAGTEGVRGAVSGITFSTGTTYLVPLANGHRVGISLLWRGLAVSRDSDAGRTTQGTVAALEWQWQGAPKDR